jgi:hypothetical protein
MTINEKTGTIALPEINAFISPTLSVRILLLLLFVIATQPLGRAAEDATEHKMFARRLPHPSREWLIKLDGATYTSAEELKAAIERLPAGSKLTWYTDCFLFLDVPLGTPPRMKLTEFRKFCSDHGVTFTTNNEGAW